METAHRIRCGPHGRAAATCVDSGHRDPVSRTEWQRVRPSATFRRGPKACIMRRIGLLRYGGTVSLNQMRYTIQAIPTFGSGDMDQIVQGTP
jgi:hypothetical protein